MSSGADRLRDVFEREDLASFLDLLDPDVTWTWWEPELACLNREQVQRRIEEVLAAGHWGRPEILAEVGDRVVIDPHSEPPVDFAPELHQVPDRRSALVALGLA